MLRPCMEPGCGELVRGRGSRCPAHTRQAERQINRAGRKVYATKRWKILRRRKLSMNPLCERCENTLAEHVHHKHGVENDPWSVDGLEALCASCHNRGTRQAQIAGAADGSC